MQTDDQIQAIREILAHGEEGMILIQVKHIFERMRANEQRIMLCFKQKNPLTSADITRLSPAAMPGGYIKKAFSSLEEMGLIRGIDQKGAAQPYELTLKGERFTEYI